ncbi:hypothetical protein Nepgr_032933 [Nepenthes gracilis]|uniref:Uncharacterized protein n=1 Tax=Nepenthes gracilis TaxID=150966 RepID=A0AAD3TK98_NEPGR|nr:hypothetical protein Nepgr_032933 [Nepenthes gracilis]
MSAASQPIKRLHTAPIARLLLKEVIGLPVGRQRTAVIKPDKTLFHLKASEQELMPAMVTSFRLQLYTGRIAPDSLPSPKRTTICDRFAFGSCRICRWRRTRDGENRDGRTRTE